MERKKRKKDHESFVDSFSCGPALKFEIKAQWGKARVAQLTLPHGTLRTPVFMPVGTQGTVKGITSRELEELGPRLILGNTFHLGLRPGRETMRELGGLHSFSCWKHNMLTDSGGFQMVSLLKLSKVTEEGVQFLSPHDGREMMLTPEESIGIQTDIGADIMMALDDVVGATVTGPRVKEATKRSVRWLKRCIDAHRNVEKQNLFGIIQGGLDAKLRKYCLKKMIRFSLPGYAIGGLSGGESKDEFWKIVSQCTGELPSGKPRYLMGVGLAIDMVCCVAMGVDMFDCVYPTRTARFGSALIDTVPLNLRSSKHRQSFFPIDQDCDCPTCKKYTRAALHILFTSPIKETNVGQLLTQHNIRFQFRLMERLQNSILNGNFPSFVSAYVSNYYKMADLEIPSWVKDSLCASGILI